MAVQFYHNVEPNNTGPRVKWLEVLLYRHLEGEKLGEVFFVQFINTPEAECYTYNSTSVSGCHTRPGSASKHLGPGKSINF